MAKIDSEIISEVVFALVGDTGVYGETQADTRTSENLKVLTEVIDTLVYEVCGMTKYRNRHEYSMAQIGKQASKFLGYLVEEYELNEFVERRQDETD